VAKKKPALAALQCSLPPVMTGTRITLPPAFPIPNRDIWTQHIPCAADARKLRPMGQLRGSRGRGRRHYEF
jgi:hypothetical protein